MRVLAKGDLPDAQMGPKTAHSGAAVFPQHRLPSCCPGLFATRPLTAGGPVTWPCSFPEGEAVDNDKERAFLLVVNDSTSSSWRR